MIIRTNEKQIDMRWVREETALILLDEHAPMEVVEVQDTNGCTLFVCTFATLKELRRIHETSARINNNYAQRRDMIAQQLAARGNPG